MQTSPLLVLVMLAGALSACNNNEVDDTTQQTESTNAIYADSSMPTPQHQPAPESPFIKVSNPVSSSSAPTVQEIRSVLGNERIVKTKPINFIYRNASLVISRDPFEDAVYNLRLVSKQAGQGMKQHFLRRVFPEGGAPEFPVIFTMNADQDRGSELVVLCRWRILHRGIGIDANLYQPIVFDNVIDPVTHQVRVHEQLTQQLGEGYDGKMEQGNEFYAYKDQASLQRKIHELR